MINNFFAFLVILLFTGCSKVIDSTIDISCEMGQASTNHPDGQDFQEILDDYVGKGIPGIALQVLSPKGAWTGSSGMADIAEGIHFTPCHVSKVGSITKLMIGTLSLKLIEEGVFKLDDPISKYIDAEILDKLNMLPDIRIRNLLNHTTGVYDIISSSDFYLDVINNPAKTRNPESLLKYAYDQDQFNLAERFPAKYSNTNYLLLSMCIDKASGIDHGALLRSKILEPYGLNNTFYAGYEKVPETTAQGYFDLQNIQQLFNVSNINTGNGNGYTGIYSNVFDLNKFTRLLLVEQTLLKDESLMEMTSNLLGISEDDNGDLPESGLGIFKKYFNLEYQGFGHEGGDLGYAANTFYFPDTETLISYVVNYGTNGNSYLRPVYSDLDDTLMSKIQE